MRFRLILFDLDGTLADSLPWFRSILRELAPRHGLRLLDDAEFEAFRELDNREIIRRLGVPSWRLPLIAQDMRRLAARDAGTIGLFPGVPEMLRALREAGRVLAVVSSNSEANARRILGASAAEVAWFGCGASLFGKAARFRQVLRRAALPAETAIAVGDELRDLHAAAEAGLSAAAVTWGYATRSALAGAGPLLVFDRPEEIAARLP
ncbi:HAD hydrolase-like protein [Muricoccus radiodurans]|uniref:HAD hydrolase-like protein n=1 Tax=Muricoccus radiodurans TaxID=2231721 RepID=UPI003CE890E3